MKIKKILILSALIITGLISPGFADECSASCTSPDPAEVSQCLLACEEN